VCFKPKPKRTKTKKLKYITYNIRTEICSKLEHVSSEGVVGGCRLLGRGAAGRAVHYLGGVCLLLGSGSDFCRDQLTWNFRLRIMFYCLLGSGRSVVITVE